MPQEPAAMAEVMQWMAVSENELLFGLARARAVKLFGRPWNLVQSQAYGRAGLCVLESRLSTSTWLSGSRNPTIVDIACYPYVSMAPQGDVSLEEFVAINVWLECFEDLASYITIDE